MSSKYKAGDRVRVRGDLVDNQQYGLCRFMGEMAEHCGKTVTITSRDYCLNNVFHIKEDSGRFTWHESMFTGLAEPEPPKPRMCRLDKVFEMPSSCYTCPIECYEVGWCKKDIDERPDDCPLREVQE